MGPIDSVLGVPIQPDRRVAGNHGKHGNNKDEIFHAFAIAHFNPSEK